MTITKVTEGLKDVLVRYGADHNARQVCTTGFPCRGNDRQVKCGALNFSCCSEWRPRVNPRHWRKK